jgi:pyruvate,water dikinase
MLPLDACVGSVAAGAKAETLARARAMGLLVADGVVLLPGETVDAPQLAAALTRLGGDRFVVRSSASFEDRAGGSAAGVFLSIVGVRAAEVVRAVDEVQKSAQAPAVRAYLTARGWAQTTAQMAVLIQPWVEADRYCVAHSSAAGFAIEERAPGEPEWGDVRATTLARDDAGALATGLRALERLVGGPVDAEFARRGDDVTWLQARPLTAVRAAHVDAPPLSASGRWLRDAEHNPDPLSTAQASLVAFVDALGVGARLQVAGGYLYVERGGAPRGLVPIALPQLRRRFDEDVAPDCARALAAATADGGLDAALAAYAHVYRRYVGELSPSLSRARAQLDQLLRANLGEPLTAHGALLGGLGGATLARDQALWELGHAPSDADRFTDYLARYGDHAPAWDVAVATDRERPERVRALAAQWATSSASPMNRHAHAEAAAEAAARALVDRLDRMARRAFKALLPTVREVLPIAEDDDLLFLRAQAVVRRALLSHEIALDLCARDDVFALTLDEVRAPPVDIRARVRERMSAHADATRRVPPSAYEDGRAEWAAPPARAVLRGAATLGQARGRALVVRALAAAPTSLPDDAVLVAPALIPSLTPLLPQARALVTDHGGALSHAATLAREYGVPAVLGVGNATALADGTELYVDGGAGRVYVLERQI